MLPLYISFLFLLGFISFIKGKGLKSFNYNRLHLILGLGLRALVFYIRLSAAKA
jgi:hypothetical protein